MKMKMWLLLLMSFVACNLSAQKHKEIVGLEIPKCDKNEVVYHTGYSLKYSEKDEQPIWVAYQLTAYETKSITERNNDFRTDPKIKTGSATLNDYAESGYDRGHLCPAQDQAWSLNAMSESFFMSNMSPQVPQFNRGVWKKLETKVRIWAKTRNGIYVVTGGVLSTPNLKKIGNNVSVPKYYYKVILDMNTLQGIGFILPNEGSKKSLSTFVVSIDEVEQITGIDFFNKLPDTLENNIEKTVCKSCWLF